MNRRASRIELLADLSRQPGGAERRDEDPKRQVSELQKSPPGRIGAPTALLSTAAHAGL
jgi:hypothetical protein